MNFSMSLNPPTDQPVMKVFRGAPSLQQLLGLQGVCDHLFLGDLQSFCSKWRQIAHLMQVGLGSFQDTSSIPHYATQRRHQ
jgi:hypothetical protein